jgi:hypothetical protein
MSPYLSLKPFLPVKPTLVSPFVDPNIFIGKKAALLSNLFGPGNVPVFAGMPHLIPPECQGKSPLLLVCFLKREHFLLQHWKLISHPLLQIPRGPSQSLNQNMNKLSQLSVVW